MNIHEQIEFLRKLRDGFELEMNYERILLGHYCRFLRSGLTVYDVGANEGVHTNMFLECVGSDGAVVAFEPIPQMADILQSRFGEMKNFELHQVALSNHEGEDTFIFAVSVRPNHPCGVGSLAPGAQLVISGRKIMLGFGPPANRQARQEWWRRQIQRQQDGSLTVAEFCRRLGVSTVTFYAWKRRFREAPSASPLVPERPAARPMPRGNGASHSRLPAGLDARCRARRATGDRAGQCLRRAAQGRRRSRIASHRHPRGRPARRRRTRR